MAKIDEATIKSLKAEHKDLILVTDKDGDEYVCRLPTAAEMERYRQVSSKEEGKTEATRGLVLASVVWPDNETMVSMLDKFAFLAVTLELKISEFAKLDTNAKAKKL